MAWRQAVVHLRPRTRGFHLVTDELLAGMPDLAGVTYCADAYEATEGADVLCLMTEWRPFRRPDFRRLGQQLKAKVIFDGRNQYEPARAAEHGLTVFPIGVPAAVAAAERAGHTGRG